jgi:hypothetical protein
MVFNYHLLFLLILNFLGREIDGSFVEVTLAKSVDINQYFRFTRGVSPSTIAANLPVNLDYHLSFSSKFDFSLVYQLAPLVQQQLPSILHLI